MKKKIITKQNKQTRRIMSEMAYHGTALHGVLVSAWHAGDQTAMVKHALSHETLKTLEH